MSSSTPSSHHRHDRHKHRTPSPVGLKPIDAGAFMTLISTALRLREETISMAFIYTHKYRAYLRANPDITDPLDSYTLSLACLSLATKSTSSPRRLRELLLPSHSLLNPLSPPVQIPSTHYDTLRQTLVTAEVLLLRILKFNIRLTLPHVYLPRILERATTLHGTEHLDEMGYGEREEADVIEAGDTPIGREAGRLCALACRSYRLGGLFPAREVAAAVVRVALDRCGIIVDDDRKWVRRVASDKVGIEDWEEAVDELRAVLREQEQDEQTV